jgi:hypothetical protein
MRINISARSRGVLNEETITHDLLRMRDDGIILNGASNLVECHVP